MDTPYAPEQGRSSLVWWALGSLVVAAIVVGVWWWLGSSQELPSGQSWGSDTTFIITREDGTTHLFSNGRFGEQSTRVPVFPRAEILPALAAKALSASSDPSDYQVVLSNGTVIQGATDPQAVPGTSKVVVRKVNYLALCDEAGACAPLYLFGQTVTSPVPFAVSSDKLAIAHPLARDIQIFNFNLQTGAISPYKSVMNTVNFATSIAFDPAVPDRLVMVGAVEGVPQEVELQPSPEPPAPATALAQTLRIGVCAVDLSIDATSESAPPLCAYKDFIGAPRGVTISAYE